VEAILQALGRSDYLELITPTVVAKFFRIAMRSFAMS